MSTIEAVDELSDICIRQAKIIRAQAYLLEQFGAETKEEEVLQERSHLRDITGGWNEDAL